MTKEEAIIILKSWTLDRDYAKESIALDMAIKALEQEPCEDVISRQAVLEVIRKCHCEEWVKADIGASIEALSSATPAEQVGWWITGDGGYTYCNSCQFVGSSNYNYCPICGTKMVEPKESEGAE